MKTPAADTKDVLANPSARKLINEYGEISLNRLMDAPTIENFFNISFEFAKSTNLISEKVMKTAQMVHDQGGLASMAMLGNAIFAIESSSRNRLINILKNAGELIKCKIDVAGARAIRE